MTNRVAAFLQSRLQENSEIISEIRELESGNGSRLDRIISQFEKNSLAISSFLDQLSQSKINMKKLYEAVALDHAAIDIEDELSKIFPFNQHLLASNQESQ